MNPFVLTIIFLVAGVWGVAVATGRGGVRLALLVGAVGFALALGATFGKLDADLGTLGLFIAAIAGGVAAGRGERGWQWPWRRRAA